MNAYENLVEFGQPGSRLRGILHVPTQARAGSPGIVFLHGWAGTRHGPHRMFVDAARRFSENGFYSLRFDYRGRGESDGDTRLATIESMVEDAKQAVDFLCRDAPVRDVILLGICSSGKVAIAASHDSHVRGLALWSAEAMGHLRIKTAKAHKSMDAIRIYLRKLTALETWKKILTGRVNARMVGKAVLASEGSNEEERKRESAWLHRFRGFKGKVLFIYGTNDPEATIASPAYSGFCREHRIAAELHEIDGANHSFYSLLWEEQVLRLTLEWLHRVA